VSKIASLVIAVVALGLSASVPVSASAAPAPASAAQATPVGMAQSVQYWGSGPYQSDDGWERRRQWREWRAQRDEARIAEAAQREAWRIEQEREARRAWRHAQREQQYGGPGVGYGYQRGW
jgi:hypothetical protein